MIEKKYLNRISWLGLASGATLVIEHLITHGGLQTEFGHEHLGLIIFIVSFFLNIFTRGDIHDAV